MKCAVPHPFISGSCVREAGHTSVGFPHETVSGDTWLGPGPDEAPIDTEQMLRVAKRVYSYLATFNDPSTLTPEGKSCGEFVIPRIAEAIRSAF